MSISYDFDIWATIFGFLLYFAYARVVRFCHLSIFSRADYEYSTVTNVAILLFFITGLAGFAYIFISPHSFELSIPSIGVASFLSIAIEYASHRKTIDNIRLWHPNATIRVLVANVLRYRPAGDHVIDYSVFNNAYTTRFGLTFLGVKPQGITKQVLNYLLGNDGWTDKQRSAILAHERGHSKFGLPCIVLQTAVAVTLLSSTSSFVSVVAAIVSVYTAIVLLSWCEELLCDMCVGLKGFSISYLLKGPPEFVPGGHPPYFFRMIAFGSRAFDYAIGFAAMVMCFITINNPYIFGFELRVDHILGAMVAYAAWVAILEI